MTNRNTKIYTLIITGEMQIKATLSYYLKPFGIAVRKRRGNNCWQECGNKEIFVHHWLKWKLILKKKHTMKNQYRGPSKNYS